MVWIFIVLLSIMAGAEGYIIFALWSAYKRKAFKVELLTEIIENV